MATMLRDRLAELQYACPQCKGKLSVKGSTFEIEPLFSQSAVQNINKLEHLRTANAPLNNAAKLPVASQAERLQDKLQSNGQLVMTNPQISHIRVRGGVK